MSDRLADRYVLDAELARGAAGTVYRAVDTATGDNVAVKVLRHDAAAEPGVVAAFLDEAETLAGIDHPAIVRPRDFIATDEVMALVMDLVEGTDLRRRIRSGGPLAPAEAAAAVSRLADALAAIHAAGIVHGDVKPGNVLVPADGGPVRLADFGVAHRSVEAYSPTHGTPEYVAPEIIDGGASTGKSDVYGLGLILYEALAARSPYRGGRVDDVLKRHRDCEPAPIPGCPPQLWTVVIACTQLDPARRPAAAELPSRLALAMPSLDGVPALAPMPPELPTTRPRGSGGPNGTPVATGHTGTDAPSTTVLAAPVPAPARAPMDADRRNRLLLIGGGAAAALALAVFGMFVLFGGGQSPAAEKQNPPSGVEQSADPGTTGPDATPSGAPTPTGGPESPTPGSETDPEGTDAPADPGSGNDNGEIPEVPGEDQVGSSLPQFP